MEEGDWMRRRHICNLFLPAEHDSLLGQNLHFLKDEAWFHLIGYINTQNKGYGSNVNLIQILKYPIMNRSLKVMVQGLEFMAHPLYMVRRLVCGVPSLPHE
jgi:hypothetical protein